MTSLRQIRDILKTIADTHPQINGYGFGDVFNVPGETQTYPMLWVEPISTEVTNKKINYSLRLFVMALCDKGELAEVDTRSETMLILNDVLIYLRRQYELVREDFVGSAQPFIGKSSDEAMGWYIDIVVDTPSNLGVCDVATA